MTIPILDRDENDHPGEYKKYKITIGGKMGCEIEPASYVRSQSGETFTCLADFDTASPLFQPGQKAEIVVETIPYGYTYSRQNAVEFVLAEQTFNYTGTLELHKNLPRL